MKYFIWSVVFLRFILIVLTLPIMGLGVLLGFLYNRIVDGIEVENAMDELYWHTQKEYWKEK